MNRTQIKMKIIKKNDHLKFFCQCGIIQNYGYPCEHFLYLAKQKRILSECESYDERVRQMTNDVISAKSYENLYDNIGIEFPNPESFKENPNEIIPFNTRKHKNKEETQGNDDQSRIMVSQRREDLPFEEKMEIDNFNVTRTRDMLLKMRERKLK